MTGSIKGNGNYFLSNITQLVSIFDLPKRIVAVLGNGVKDDVSELLMQIRGNKLLTKMLCVRRVHLLFPQRGVAFAAAAALSLAG